MLSLRWTASSTTRPRMASADTDRYANMVAADRELKLSGYEVFRFGGAELQGGRAPDMVKEFFYALFDKYHVPIPVTGT